MFRLIKSFPKKLPITLQTRCASDVPSEAFAVVIGAGVAGSSVAYHLTKRNFRDIVILEKGKIASGTTSHSPGLVSAAHPAYRYKPILAWSVKLYSKLQEETGEDVGFAQHGTIRLATNERRLHEFRKYTARDYFHEGDVCKTSLVTPEEISELAKIVDTSKILGGLYTTGDGYINSSVLTRALIKGAQMGGAKLIENCPAFTLIEQPSAKGDWIIRFEDGHEIRAVHIVNAAGLWASEVGKLTNNDIPLVFVEHQYATIGPISQVNHLHDLPAVIDHDSRFYIRRNGNHLLFGGFESRTTDVILHEDWTGKVPEEATMEAHSEKLAEAYKGACNLIPCLNDVEMNAKASAFTMTADGYPLVGPTNSRLNYWLQAGYFDGVSSGGGMGKYLADWIIDGEPSSELFDTDATRFNGWINRDFITKKSKETYSLLLNWSVVNRLAGRPTERVSGIYARLVKEGGIFSFRNGWEVAQTFSVEDEHVLPAMIREYQMVTNKCGIIDLSWKGKIEVRGADAADFLNYVLTNEVPRLGTISSGLTVTSKGKLFAPFKVFHHDHYRSEFILLTDPERESRDLAWLKHLAAARRSNVDISAVSEYLASIALVGPCSQQVLQDLTITDVSDKNFGERTTRLMRLGNVPAIAARTSASTGQLSYEFFHNRADTLKLYNAIKEAGKKYGIVNFGQATHNMLRTENGFRLWGRELTLDTNPFECGLGHLVDLRKKDFFGRNALLELATKQWSRRQVLLVCDPLEDYKDWESFPKGMEVVRRIGHDERIGQVTSGTYSVRLLRPLAFAWVNSDLTSQDELCIDIGGRRIGAQIIEEPPVVSVD